jgi:hypothetical protein
LSRSAPRPACHPLTHGLEAFGVVSNNRDMIKQSRIFEWDDEPVDVRPTGFVSGHSALSERHPISEPWDAPRSSGGTQWKTLLVYCGVVLASGAFAMINLAPLLRG